MLLPESYLQPNPRRDPKKVAVFLTITGIFYTLYVVFLYYLWYQGTGSNGFHLFNDNAEWLQMDKLGHFTVHFQSALMPSIVFMYAGYDAPKAAGYGFIFSLFALMPVEVMDGFSPAWGFSWGDIAANVLGSAFAYGQLRGFGRIIILPKFSFHISTIYALARPDMFGTDYIQNSLKDYNGQTYWLTVDVNRMTGKKILPSWLLLSIGYGAEGMYGGHTNVFTDKQGIARDYSHEARYRQFYISFDINFTHLIKNPFWQRILYPLNIFKVPFPTLEISERGPVFHWLYW